MAKQRSRAYKLQLSREGIQLFLRCHIRLCHAVGDFLPYGTTLFVAVALLPDRCSGDDMVARLTDLGLARYAGRNIRYVGTSPALFSLMATLTERVARTGALHPSPQTWKMFLMALDHMEDLDDRAMMTAFQGVCPELNRRDGRQDK